MQYRPIVCEDNMNRLLKPIFLEATSKNAFRLIVARYSVATGSKEHIDSLVKGKKVVVFMKGTPDAPRCGFSNAVVQILNFHGVKNYSAHDVLADENLRKGIKDYTNWPTIPQVFIGGEFVGGCDIMLELHKNGELIEELKKVDIRSALLDQENGNTKEG